MKVSIKKSFERDTAKIHDKKLLAKIEAAIKESETAKDSTQISNLEKLKGHKEFIASGLVITGLA